MTFKRSTKLGLAVAAALGVVTGANANLVQNGQLDLGGQGFGNAPRLLTIQGQGNNTTESGAIGIVGGAIAVVPGIANGSVFLGNGVTNAGGDEVSPLNDTLKFGIPTLGSLGWTSGADVRLLFNATEPGGNGLSVTDVTLKFYNGNTVIAAIDGSFALASTITGNGSSGFLINVDAAQQTFLNTSVFGQAGSSGFRIALESTITGVAGGPESYLAVPGGSLPPTAIPEPESYAMMLAGLGMLGFIARRRKRNQI
jgi:hypothetical protein